MTQTEATCRVDEVLTEACDRNTAVELHVHMRGGGLVVAKSRIVKIDDQQLYLDKPEATGQKLNLQDGLPLDVHFAIRRERFFFKSTLTDARAHINVNEHNKIIGLTIARPTAIKSGQRRNDFRVELANMRRIDVLLHDAATVKPDLCPLDTKRFSAELIDVSAGGLRVKVDRSERDEFHATDRFFALFPLPDDLRTDAVFLVKPVHWSASEDRSQNFVGLQLIPWPEVEFARNQRRLARFVAKIERQLAKFRAATNQ